MIEAKYLIMHIVISGTVVTFGVCLPHIIQRVTFLKKNISEVTLGVIQGIIIVYGLLSALNSVLMYVGIRLI